MNHPATHRRIRVAILGAGGTSVDFGEAALACGHDVLGLLDDAARGTVRGFPILGPLTSWSDLPDDVRFFCGIGSATSYTRRLDLLARLDIPDDRFVTIVHPAASVSPSAVLGPGCGVLAFSALGAGVVLDAHVEILQLCLVAHDCHLESGAIVAGGANLAGHVHIGRCAFVGAGVAIRNGLRVGDGALLGMNSTLLEDLPAGATYVGSPARRLAGK